MTSRRSVSRKHVGVQEPRVRLRPPTLFDTSDGEEAIELAAGYGLTADEWQEGIIVGWMARRKDGRLAAGTCGTSVARQNGKNGVVEIIQLHKLALQGRKILHTAHEVKTARKAFKRLLSFFDNKRKYPELAAMVKEIRRTNGQEAIILHELDAECSEECGCVEDKCPSIEYVARSRGSGRGFTVDDLFCDEAQELSDEQLEALMPTIASAPQGDSQVFYLGTPPGPKSNGEVFTRIRKAAVEGKDRRLCWDEWSIPDDMHTDEAMRHWKEFVFDTNPALGIRLQFDVVLEEHKNMSPEGFCRERLGRWDTANKVPPAFDYKHWLTLSSVEGPSAAAKRCFAVRFAVDGSAVGLAAASREGRGLAHVEAIMMLQGMYPQLILDWVLERVGRASQIVVDGRDGAGDFVQALRDEKVPARMIWTPNTEQVITAHSMLDGAVKSARLTHKNQPILNAQVQDVARRKIGMNGGFGWVPRDPNGSAVLIDAVTLAYWAVMTTKRRGKSGSGGATFL